MCNLLLDNVIKCINFNLDNLNRILGTNFADNKDVIKEYNTVGDLVEAINDKYVPCAGKADTLGGEIVRALCRVNYRYYNDGDVAGYGYGVETVSSSLGFIADKTTDDIYEIASQLVEITDPCEQYKDLLENLIIETLDYLITNPTLFTASNTHDSRYRYDEVLFNDYDERLNYFTEDDEECEDYYDEDYA